MAGLDDCGCGVGAVSKNVRSTAGHVLATGEATPDEARRLAAAVLGDDSLTPDRTRSREDLTALLAKIDGMEGQSERAAEIRRKLEVMGDE